ncbi:sulfurtransferase [Sedimenticola sp.]|uniref:sulfurtransferase n=1 Tax=Sedimenticola sp. TaxID=1940285 RepID=UPI002584AF87|nr:sulfurtransferase [Sedimenticola sp.]MCW8904996.1 sulfurtransferase [Sedimenticola sp.]
MNITKKIGGGLALLGLCSIAWGATPLVDVDWVKANSCNADVRVLDIRNPIDGGSKTDYMRAHIPCAVHTDYLKGGWRVEVDKIPGQLPPVDKLEKLIGDLGVDNKTHVVIYHAGKNALDLGSATRVYWTFKLLGHDNVSILDGGLAAYTGDKKNALEKGNNSPDPKTFKATLNEALLATKADVQQASGNGVTLIDNRPTHQYRGINRHPKSKRSGTIPQAQNLPESWLTVNGGGKFRDVETLKKLYQVANVPTEGDAINFCNTGHWASLGWFVGSELMGNKKSRLYDGSMVEWSADESLPMTEEIKL